MVEASTWEKDWNSRCQEGALGPLRFHGRGARRPLAGQVLLEPAQHGCEGGVHAELECLLAAAAARVPDAELDALEQLGDVMVGI